MRFLFRLTVLAVLVAMAALFWSLRTYSVLAREQMVAVARCVERRANGTYLLELTPTHDGVSGIGKVYILRGDQWMVGGDLLKWKPWVSVLGARPLYKLTRLESRYLRAVDEAKNPRSVIELNGGSSPLWQWLYRRGIRLPFVDAVYGNAAFMRADPGTEWGVYLSASGFWIRPLRRKL